MDRAGAHHVDPLPAHQVWLYPPILPIGYLISRALAKFGGKQHDER